MDKACVFLYNVKNIVERGRFTMLGSMLSKIRKDKNMTKVELAKKTGLNIGHLTHIEKDERNPSHKTLKSITNALEIPYKPISSLYDIQMTDDHKRCNMLKHLSCSKVLAVDSYSNFVDCPKDVPNACLALKVLDDSMEPKLKKDSYCFIELNVPLNNKDIGLFKYNNNLIIRRFIIRKDKLVLRSDNKIYSDIDLSEDDDFTIIGRILISNI